MAGSAVCLAGSLARSPLYLETPIASPKTLEWAMYPTGWRLVHAPNGFLQTLKRASFPTASMKFLYEEPLLLQPTFCRDCTRMTIDNPCDNPSFVPVQPSQYNSTGTQSAQVSVIVCHGLNCSLSCVSIQPLGGLDHLPAGIDSAGPYPAMNYVNPLPPTRYTSSVGYDNPSHMATVSIHLRSRVSIC